MELTEDLRMSATLSKFVSVCQLSESVSLSRTALCYDGLAFPKFHRGMFSV